MPKSSIPLGTLRGFASAARLASFVDAAKELHLSHSAVSHQIRQLESELGQALFRRVGRSVVLTDAGQDFARTVRDVLGRLEDGVARLAPYQKPGGVILYTTNVFARGYILPRLMRFHDQLPDIDLWLDTSERTVDFQQDEVDILITDADGAATAGIVGKSLIPDTRVALSSPQLADRLKTIAVDQWPLLHDESQTTWREWFTVAGLEAGDAINGPNFSDHALMLEAAAAGHGVALGSVVCAQPYLDSGALVVLPGPTFAGPDHRIYCDLQLNGEGRIRRVYEWFIYESRAA